MGSHPKAVYNFTFTYEGAWNLLLGKRLRTGSTDIYIYMALPYVGVHEVNQLSVRLSGFGSSSADFKNTIYQCMIQCIGSLEVATVCFPCVTFATFILDDGFI